MNTSQKNGSLIAPLFARETPPPHEVVAEVGRGLFRTSEDEGLVAEAVAGLLARGWYATAAVLVQAALLNRSFGSHHYVGHRYDYTAAERFFDKFVDMCVHFELGDRLVPFCVYALSSRDEASGWARPAGEYLAALAERDRAGTLSEVLALPGAGEALQAITVLGGHVDEVAAIAVDRLLNGGVAARAEVRGYLSANKRYALDGLLAGLAGNTPTREQAMKALLLFKQDETVKAALRGAFAVEPSAALRRLLQAELGVRFASEVISTPAALEARARGSTVRGTTNAFSLSLKYADGTRLSRAAVSYILGVLRAKTVPVAEKAAIASVKRLLDAAALDLACERLRGVPEAAAFTVVFGTEAQAGAVFASYDARAAKPSDLKRFLAAAAVSPNRAAQVFLCALAHTRTFRKVAVLALEEAQPYTGISPEDAEEGCADTFSLDGSGTYAYSKTSYARLEGLDIYYYGIANVRLNAWGKRLTAGIADHTDRFRRAFEDDRRWRGDVFRRNIIAHPVMSRVAASLLFGVYNGKTKYPALFSVENGATLDLQGKPFNLNADDFVGLVHPAEISPANAFVLSAGVKQVFPQLQRPTAGLRDTELGQGAITRYIDTVLPYAAFVKAYKEAGFSAVVGKSAVQKRMGEYLLEFAYVLQEANGQTSVTLREAKVYPLADVPRHMGRYLTERVSPVPLRSLSQRAAANIMYDLARAALRQAR